MAKKNRTGQIVLLVVIILVVIVAYQKYGGVQEEEQQQQQETAPAEPQEETQVEESVEEAPAEEDAQPLYPDLCYAAGGKPVAESKGCAEGEESVGDVPGFKTPHICCVKQ